MINVYKYDGEWKTEDGKPYSVKTINEEEKSNHILDGWSASLESALSSAPKAKPSSRDKKAQNSK